MVEALVKDHAMRNESASGPLYFSALCGVLDTIFTLHAFASDGR